MYLDLLTNTKLYSNYTSYIYEIKNDNLFISNEEKMYLLFNPSIHYWIAIDSIALEIFNILLDFGYIDAVREKLMNKYSITETIFNEDVYPIINNLVDLNFFTSKETPKEAEWINNSINLDSINTYPFNDIYISLSDHCNLNCIYCFNKATRKNRILSRTETKLSNESIIRTLQEFKELGGTGVVFTGGEPTLNKSLIDLCTEAKSMGLITSIITNGTLLNSIDLESLLPNIDNIGISLDSIIEDELQVLWDTNSLNIKDDIFRYLDTINELGLKYKNFKINMMPIVCTVNKASLANLVSTITKKLSNCEVSWQMTRYSPISIEDVDKLLNITETDYFYAVSNSLKTTFIKEDNDSCKLNHKINAYSFSNSGKFLPPKSPKLLTCAPSFFIANNGDVYPCQGFEKNNYKLGNISSSSLSELFYKKDFSHVRDRIIVNKIMECSTCELKFVCTSKCGGCITECSKNPNNCKDIAIKRLFLQTQIY